VRAAGPGVHLRGRDGHAWPTGFSDLSNYAAGAYGRSRGEMATRPQYLGGALNVGPGGRDREAPCYLELNHARRKHKLSPERGVNVAVRNMCFRYSSHAGAPPSGKPAQTRRTVRSLRGKTAETNRSPEAPALWAVASIRFRHSRTPPYPPARPRKRSQTEARARNRCSTARSPGRRGLPGPRTSIHTPGGPRRRPATAAPRR
jgi:hypothetical protein